MTVVHKKALKSLVCAVAFSGFVLPFTALASGSTVSPLTAGASVGEQRLVSFFFSDEAWGGVPFSEADKQKAMVDAMLSGQPVRLATDVLHLLSASEARVRAFTAVFEIDGSIRPPTMKAGYELELLVPYSRDALTVELVNADTGVVNRFEVAPEGSL